MYFICFTDDSLKSDGWGGEIAAGEWFGHPGRGSKKVPKRVRGGSTMPVTYSPQLIYCLVAGFWRGGTSSYPPRNRPFSDPPQISPPVTYPHGNSSGTSGLRNPHRRRSCLRAERQIDLIQKKD